MRILLTGPTAVGKTSVSLLLANQLNAEIISSDSRQCYQYMNIGTATPTAEELDQVHHYNISIIDPAEKDSAANFYERSQDWEQAIAERGKNILYIGGSTLHQRVIIQPFDDVPAANDANVAQLEQKIEQEGIETLYQKLQKVDPEYTKKIDGLNTQRIIRALDVWMQTGQPFSSFHTNKKVSPPDDMLVFGLRRDRKRLYDRINKRVDQMFEQGFLEEVKSIIAKGYSLQDPGLNTVGYKQAIRFIRGDMKRNRMIEDIKAKTRQYAKRQLTWFRRWDFVHWLDADDKTAAQIAETIMTELQTNDCFNHAVT